MLIERVCVSLTAFSRRSERSGRCLQCLDWCMRRTKSRIIFYLLLCVYNSIYQSVLAVYTQVFVSVFVAIFQMTNMKPVLLLLPKTVSDPFLLILPSKTSLLCLVAQILCRGQWASSPLPTVDQRAAVLSGKCLCRGRRLFERFEFVSGWS